MQNKKTEKWSSELPDLTEKQYKFVMGILEGKAQAEAYRAAYNAENMNKNSVWVASSRLCSNAKIRLWLNHIRKEKTTAAGYTHDKYMEELEELRNIAIESGNIGAAVQACHHKGKAVGHEISRHMDLTPKEDTDLIEQVRKTLGDAAAKEAKEKMGLH